MLLRQQSQSLVVHAPAKLNLFLEVLGKRPDGYHELETLMITVGHYDSLRFTEVESSDLQLSCRWAGTPKFAPATLPHDDNNLVFKAARLLREVTGIDRGVSVELTKRIPLEAGLAGGSSDAAATLKGLNRLWNLNLTDRQLLELAARLGSDVPFFLTRCSAAVCRGRGELIEPVMNSQRLHFVIAKPRSGLSTAAVFRQCRPASSGIRRSSEQLVDALRAGSLSYVADGFFNALQAPAEELNPDVQRLRCQFDRLPFVGHQMSGSGTAYFGLCSHREQARALAVRVRSWGCDDVFVASSQP